MEPSPYHHPPPPPPHPPGGHHPPHPSSSSSTTSNSHHNSPYPPSQHHNHHHHQNQHHHQHHQNQHQHHQHQQHQQQHQQQLAPGYPPPSNPSYSAASGGGGSSVSSNSAGTGGGGSASGSGSGGLSNNNINYHPHSHSHSHSHSRSLSSHHQGGHSPPPPAHAPLPPSYPSSNSQYYDSRQPQSSHHHQPHHQHHQPQQPPPATSTSTSSSSSRYNQLQSPIQTHQPSRPYYSPPPPSPGPYNPAPTRNNNYYDPVGGRETPRDWNQTSSRYPSLTSPTQQSRQPMHTEGPQDRPRTPPQAPRSPTEYRTPHGDVKRQMSPTSVNGGPRRVSVHSMDANYPPRGPEFQSPPYRPPVMASSPPIASSTPGSAKKSAMSISALLSGSEERPPTAQPRHSPPPPPPPSVPVALPPNPVASEPSPPLSKPVVPTPAPVEPRDPTPPPAPAPKEPAPTPVAQPQSQPIAAAATVATPATPSEPTPRPKRKYVRKQPIEGVQVNMNSPTSTRQTRHHSPDRSKMDIDEDTPVKPLRTDKNSNKNPHPIVDFDAVDAEDDISKDTDLYAQKREFYLAKARKRKLQANRTDDRQCKHRRLNFSKRVEEVVSAAAVTGRIRGEQHFHDAAYQEILRREDFEEKERKKEMQRIRRRAKAASEHRAKAEQAAKDAAENAERQRVLMEEAKKAGKLLPIERTLTFRGYDDVDSEAQVEEEVKKVKKKPGKPKRRTDDPKELNMLKADVEARPPPPPEPVREPTPEPILPNSSKAYNTMYEQIWRDLARRDIPKLSKHQQYTFSIKQSNHKKTSLLASKEARRWQLRTTKNTKDVQARAKKSMREMTAFWKRNEREERDMRRRAEREALDRAKKEEEERESRRQARKLNFLISQTELYSHFIGKKIKTDEVERSTDKVTGAPPAQPSTAAPVAHVDDGELGEEVTRIEDLDFDEADDADLKAAATTNAHLAVEAARKRAQEFNADNDATALNNVNLDSDEMNFQNPTSLGDIYIDQPKLLTCQLKEYQLKGLNWLVNLYEQGINGILADEMGLGKTVQSISVMAYLAEYHNIWGPFLVIAPASTLHNWQQEIAKFVPDLKVLPYWGSTKDRKILRKFWDRKHLTYNKEAPFHVLVTSYQIVVLDSQYFQRIKWQYMILDEAQAIKSSNSARWKSLLGFSCRNRLLLTGTPIQNNMQELWALLHFIMPTLFDSHDEFSEWFSKDIESHAQSNTQLNEAQLRRLHMILKPFMLRRIKKHVQSELGDKIEEDVYCELTYRQRSIYRALRNKINMADIIDKAVMGDEGSQSLMNLVMQFRKVCNHPDLFERADVASPMAFSRWPETVSFLREGYNVEVPYGVRNLIDYELPRLVARDGRLDIPGEKSKFGFRKKWMDSSESLFNIWNPQYLVRNYAQEKSTFGFLRFIDTSPAEASRAFHSPIIDRAVQVFAENRLDYEPFLESEEKWVPIRMMLLINTGKQKLDQPEPQDSFTLRSLKNISRNAFENEQLNRLEPMLIPKATAPPITISCSSLAVSAESDDFLFNPRVRRLLFPPLTIEEDRLVEDKVEISDFPTRKLLPEPDSAIGGFTSIQVPSMRRFVAESGKLARLDSLLKQLKAGGHRVLLYFQMTRMIDLMEEYLSYRQYKYLRLDGSSKLEDRRDMVADWQTKPELFIFLLSTRAGGLGINLTAADTVIFYDSDWNPTIDSQAMDRAHRLGQTKQVHVYRLITRGTVEERILLRAKQKAEVQKVVVGGGEGEYKNVDFNKGSREMAMLLLDDEDGDGKTLEQQMDARAKQREAEDAAKGKGRKGAKRKKAGLESLEEMYHEGEGHFDDNSNKPSEASTPAPAVSAAATSARGGKRGGRGGKSGGPSRSHRRKSAKERMEMADGVSGSALDEDVEMGM
ncbi:putative DNA helicase ino80 [Orbilia oligospora]|nr:putative DNA helicase ino80 [Orbilia oligospora]KAF3177431.1 putative DNA helicase ino80 [Orbilia oligospora]KAF3244500.1 putative DNA helicase ino80 [Orbilia oligospora]KAF3268189.1 putative DNA helicase ino80 [Orbilia oligospora]KAF3295963.1 putative DNA helicase ino80 [Orbilia oligospora]